MEFEPGTCKVQQRGSRFRSRQRTKAMAIALGVAMTITLGLLSLVNNTTAVGAENVVGPVTRHLRSLLLDQKVSEYGEALDQQPLAASMEATSRRSVPQNPGGPLGGGRAMEAIAPRYEKKAAPETIAEAVAKAEEAEEIAEEALIVALGAENDLQAIEAITEASILSLATNSITEGLGGEEIVIVGEIEDSDDSSDSQEEHTARKNKAEKHKDW